MKKIPVAMILGAVLLCPTLRSSAASLSSDWPCLSADASQSNFNATEKTLKPANVLKLKVRWTSAIAEQSYPIVAGGRAYVPVVYKGKIHVRILDAAKGTKVAAISKDALGGLLDVNGTLYLAGRSLQSVDSSGTLTAQIKGPESATTATFAYPEWDGKTLFAGYAASKSTAIYTVDTTTNQLVRKLASNSGVAAAVNSRIVTNAQFGSAMYLESSGRQVAAPAYFGSYWFGCGSLAYDVASVKQKKARLYAVDGTGHLVWSRQVAPALATQGSEWPHACTSSTVYVSMLRPLLGIEGLDVLTGRILWSRSVQDVQRIALADNVIFALTYGLGRPVRLVLLNATSGKVLGAIVLSAGFFTFNSPNQLMVADGMVFIRATGPAGRAELVALGLPNG